MTVQEVQSGSCPAPAAKSYMQEPIAVVGMACRLPGNSNSPHELWEFLRKGKVAANQPPSKRFNLHGHWDSSDKPTTLRSPGGMFLEGIDLADFDASFFNISHVDAISMDPQQRQLLEVVYEGLENAGITMNALSALNFGCFVGSYEVDYAWMHARDPQNRPPSCAIGVGRAILSNRISHFLNIKGPSLTLDTACSGSLVAVDLACRYLQTGEISGAIVAGANLFINPEHIMDNGALRNANSKTGKCHTFDSKADGYVKAEAINTVILKRLEDAVRDGDPIRAVIRGTANNHNGRTPGIASPSSQDQSEAIKSAYRNANITDYSLTSYLECHGTGTAAGDPIEVKSIASVFAESRRAEEPLVIGSVKGNIGHSEPSAGISGLLKAILAIEHGIIPGNPLFQTLNPEIDIGSLAVEIPKAAIPFPTAPFRRASVNSFGFGGSNCHAIVDEPKAVIENYVPAHTSSLTSTDIADDDFDDDDKASRPYLLLFSANDDNSLKAYTKQMSRHLSNLAVTVGIRDLAYTLSERRSHHFNRGFVITREAKVDETTICFGKRAASPPKIGFVFTGQGAQWPCMGKELLNTFPGAAQVVRDLDTVLQSRLPTPPRWSLYEELTMPRTPEHLREPEFSQPLVTALQLALISVLSTWGVKPQSVVGHSSGEIAAASAAGLITPEEAIIIAYHRGLAAKLRKDEGEDALGMLAIGTAEETLRPYLEGLEGIQIACYNSPRSLTLSGIVPSLEEVKARLTKDGHFARLLQVDLAYHSTFMGEISKEYESLLLRDLHRRSCKPSHSGDDVTMFSSVYGRALARDQDTDVAYWKSNMVSAVLFDSAFREMVAGKEGVDFAVEIGPAGALAGPIGQIKNSIENGPSIGYAAALNRGAGSINAALDVAGKLYLHGVPINMAKVNGDPNPEAGRPRVITDLPNYAWNHTTKYWYECSESREWRFKQFPSHDLLGNKVMGTSWHSPTFKRILKLAEVPWLKDHRLGSDVVMPAAGFIAMAIEAMFQTHVSLNPDEGGTGVGQLCYRLRNTRFEKALVIEEEVPAECTLTMNPLAGTKDSWLEFKISSTKEGVSTDHASGLIRVEDAIEKVATSNEISPLRNTTPGDLWYKMFSEVGYTFGAEFQKQLVVEAIAGQRESRSHIDFTEPPCTHDPQSPYPIHPAVLDGCFQSTNASVWNGSRTNMNAVLIPAIIDDLIINRVPASGIPKVGVAVASAEYSGRGRREIAKNYHSSTSVYHPETGALLVQLTNLSYHELDVGTDLSGKHTFMQSTFKPDITMLHTSKQCAQLQLSDVQDVLDLAAHKKPALRVLEINLVSGDTSCLWLEGRERASRLLYKQFSLVVADAKDLETVQNEYGQESRTTFALLDTAAQGLGTGNGGFDFVVAKTTALRAGAKLSTLCATPDLMADSGRILVVEPPHPPVAGTDHDVGTANMETSSAALKPPPSFQSDGFGSSIRLPCGDEQKAVYLCTPASELSNKIPEPHKLHVVHLKQTTFLSESLRAALSNARWHVKEQQCPSVDIATNSTVLILDELYESILSTISADQWKIIKDITTRGCKLLWVTKGAQLGANYPERAMANGLFRTICAEDPSAHCVTLDIEDASAPTMPSAIIDVLAKLHEPKSKKAAESEFVLRDGVIYVNRIVPDELVNAAKAGAGREFVRTRLHDAQGMVRLQAERIGSFDSLQWSMVKPPGSTLSPGSILSPGSALSPNNVEIEVFATGLNFKDVAVSMGIVPENEYLLGLEAAGVVRRIGADVHNFAVGDHVVTVEKGSLANRIQAPAKQLLPIPHDMTFEEAATIPVVFVTAMYSIVDVGKLRKGQSILIHSATGGVGIACIQLAKHIGAEIYATVGTDVKRQFLQDRFGICPNRIFSSRDASFAPSIMKATNRKGVDLIINPLVGDLLDASWRICADGGNLVDISKRDSVQRNFLSMEPFDRNCSFRAVDISYSKHFTVDTLVEVLTRVFHLMEKGVLEPIMPITTFSYDQIQEAFAYMRSGRHTGKIVITDGPDGNVELPIRPYEQSSCLRDDAAYLIAGGLKGLCGSLAIHMARRGAKHIISLSRSGCSDDRSQTVMANCNSLGCQVYEAKGDIANLDDVMRAFSAAPVPIGGVIQGSMVLRDKPYETMTVDEYHECITCKVTGTWNLHTASLTLAQPLHLFTLLSSVSGVVGNKGQANYAAANTFLDAFAAYRRSLGLIANSIDLGVVQDVGYVAARDGMTTHLGGSQWTPITEAALCLVLDASIAQQRNKDGDDDYNDDVRGPINPASSAQLVTGIALPQRGDDDSDLVHDARFAALFLPHDGAGASGADITTGRRSADVAVRAFLALRADGGAASGAMLPAALDVLNAQLMKTLRLPEPLEPGKPLSVYGLDSLSAVEIRNWIRAELGAQVTTLEIMGAISLVALGEKVVAKLSPP